jgi:hypothetical protein
VGESQVTVYEELLQCAQARKGGFARLCGEPDDRYFDRLVRAVSMAPDDAWSHLGDSAVEWYEKQAALLNEDIRVIPSCPGYNPPPTKKSTLTDIIRAIVVQNPDWGRKQIHEALAKMGVENIHVSTIDTMRSATLSVIKVAKELNKWVA